MSEALEKALSREAEKSKIDEGKLPKKDREELIFQIYKKYRIDVHPDDPVFSILLILAEAIILDDAERLEKLEGKLGIICDESAISIAEDKDAAMAEFNSFASGKFKQLENRLNDLISKGERAQETILKKQQKASSPQTQTSTLPLMLLWFVTGLSVLTATMMMLMFLL